jgi:hypothetical protein
MQILPAQQNVTNVTAYASSASPNALEQDQLRADIPPIEQSEKNAGGQNQQFFPVPEQSSGTPAGDNQSLETTSSNQANDAQTQDSGRETEQTPQSRSATNQEISEEDQVVLDQLKARDREVRVHEAAHAAVGGRYAGSPSLQYARGPDGRNYAVGGEVSISTSPVAGDPQATIEKARVIRAAALAPAEPSSQDRRVAAEAAQMEIEAQAELRAMQSENTEQEEARKAEQEKPRAEANVEETETEQEAPEPVVVPVVQTQGTDQAEADSETDAAVQEEQPANAREELEKILLGSTGLIQQANQLGLVDPQNPYGKSGFLDVIA